MADKLTSAQHRAIATLLTERDVRAAAFVAGVPERTVSRWLTLPTFRAELQAAQQAAIDGAIRRLSELTGTAVETLKKEMERETAQPGERIRAADVVLKRLLDLKKLHELEERLAVLESALATRGESLK